MAETLCPVIEAPWSLIFKIFQFFFGLYQQRLGINDQVSVFINQTDAVMHKQHKFTKLTQERVGYNHLAATRINFLTGYWIEVDRSLLLGYKHAKGSMMPVVSQVGHIPKVACPQVFIHIPAVSYAFTGSYRLIRVETHRCSVGTTHVIYK